MSPGTLAGRQAIYMGVACLSAQPLFHSRAGEPPWPYGTYLLLPQSAPTCTPDWGWCTSPGDLEGFFSVDTSPVLLFKGLQADTTTGPDLGLVGWLQVFAFGELDDLLLSAWWLAWVLSEAGNGYLSRLLAIFCTISRSWRRYRPSNNME